MLFGAELRNEDIDDAIKEYVEKRTGVKPTTVTISAVQMDRNGINIYTAKCGFDPQTKLQKETKDV